MTTNALPDSAHFGNHPCSDRVFTHHEEEYMKTCEKCGKEYEDSLEACPKCAKRKRQFIIAGVVIAIVVIAILKFIFIF
jgi:uncharacterized OB-fold protein